MFFLNFVAFVLKFFDIVLTTMWDGKSMSMSAFRSILKEVDVIEYKRKYRVPNNAELRLPGPRGKIDAAPNGFVTMFFQLFVSGVRYLPSHFLLDILSYFQLSI